MADAPVWSHSLFEVNAQAVGDSVDVVEEGDDLSGVVDGPVGEARVAQSLNVGLGHGARVFRELHGVVAQCPIRFGQLGRGVVGLYAVDPLFVFNLRPEIP